MARGAHSEAVRRLGLSQVAPDDRAQIGGIKGLVDVLFGGH
jgi:hypothetical protein